MDAIRCTILEENNDLFYYTKKGIQGLAFSFLLSFIYKKVNIQTLSPLIRNRMATNNTMSNINFKIANYRTRHLYFYGFLGGMGYDYFVNQEKFFKNTPFGLIANHFLFGGLFVGMINLKYAYKGALIAATIGSVLTASKFKEFKKRYPEGFKIQFKNISDEQKQEILEKEKLEYLSFNTMGELIPDIDINGWKTFGFF